MRCLSPSMLNDRNCLFLCLTILYSRSDVGIVKTIDVFIFIFIQLVGDHLHGFGVGANDLNICQWPILLISGNTANMPYYSHP